LKPPAEAPLSPWFSNTYCILAFLVPLVKGSGLAAARRPELKILQKRLRRYEDYWGILKEEQTTSIGKTSEGSTGRLIQLCLGYFVFYVITGITVKYFTGSAAKGLPGMTGVEFLVYSTVGGTALALLVVLVRRWYHLPSIRTVTVAGRTIPSEFLYIIPSGICTAVVIPTTTLMYVLPISVMVAMVIMRGSVIVISRVVDAIQLKKGLSDKKVYAEENIAVLFAIAAVAVNVFSVREGGFEFLRSVPAMAILSSYIVAYSIRIYIMNYYKNTRPKGATLNNKAFFAVEQIAASSVLLVVGAIVFYSPSLFHASGPVIEQYRGAIAHPLPHSSAAIAAGMAFGAVSFFSVFLFMFKGRTATFAGLVNRLTSLVAGTTATVFCHYALGARLPERQDWLALLLILIAIAFLSRSERKRTAELAASRQRGSEPSPGREESGFGARTRLGAMPIDR
jgi:hypothetical protein